jgi:hypothetical protein
VSSCESPVGDGTCHITVATRKEHSCLRVAVRLHPKAVRLAQDVELVLLSPMPQALMACLRANRPGPMQLIPANDAVFATKTSSSFLTRGADL